MAITRRQFVTRLGALAAAVGMSQADLSKVTEAFAHAAPWGSGGWTDKPKVIWVHGAECTGDSTSLLGLFENALEPAIEGTTTPSVYNALNIIGGVSGAGGVGGGNDIFAASQPNSGHPFGHRTAYNTGVLANGAAAPVGIDFDNVPNNTNANGLAVVDIADVVLDFLDIQYHETIMGAGGDLAYKLLGSNVFGTGSNAPFVLVVEGSVQDSTMVSPTWASSGASGTPWCAIGESGNPTTPPVGWDAELSFDVVVDKLATQANCAAVIAIGQCAAFGGYPACVSPVYGAKQTPAYGVQDFLVHKGHSSAAQKVINVPGCPTNPWWFVLTVVAWLVDYRERPDCVRSRMSGPLGILTNSADRRFDQLVLRSTRPVA